MTAIGDLETAHLSVATTFPETMLGEPRSTDRHSTATSPARSGPPLAAS